MSENGSSIVAQWNEVALAAIREEKPFPTVITRALHIAHAAMYDAYAAYDPDAAGAYSSFTATGSAADIETAVSFAAFTALMEVLPDRQYMFEDFLETLDIDPNSAAAQVGLQAAQAVIDTRALDGSNWEEDYEDTSGYEPVNDDDPDYMSDPDFDPNAWTPLRVPNGTVRDEDGIPIATDNPATYDVQKPITPHWGEVTPFAIADGADFRPVAPPKLGDFSTYIDATGKVTTGDAAFREQFGDLVDISANLTAEQKAIAEYWADGPQTSTPPGHWNEIAHDLSAREGYGLADDVKMFFALNNALFDTGIAVWDAKYAHDFVRPQTAIQYLYGGEEIESWAGPNKGTQTIDGSEWQPYQDVTFVTPAFPEYTSGHSGFSYAAATVLAAYTGTDVYYDGTSRGAYDLDADGELDLIGTWSTDELAFEEYDGGTITLQWETLWDAAAEAGSSRLYGGIHIQDGDLRAREMGAAVGRDVWAETLKLFDLDASNEIVVTDSSQSLTLGEGDDEVVGTSEDLDGLRITDFERGDSITIDGLTLSPDQLGVRQGSAILEIDTDGDGDIDSEITLEGDFAGQSFLVLSAEGRANVTLANVGDVGLTDANERFITTDDGDNAITAGAGLDVVIGSGGNDVLDGDEGDDVLIGGDGQDVLIGAGGIDELRGGADADIFSFALSDIPDGAAGPFVDIIKDFTPGEDTIEIAGYGIGFADLILLANSAGVSVILPGSRVLVLEGIASEDDLSDTDFSFVTDGRDVVITDVVLQQLTEADDRYVSTGEFADIVTGLDGNDALVTSQLNDVIDGGIGDDVILAGDGDDEITGGGGFDQVTSGDGNDTIFFNFSDDAETAVVSDTVKDYVAGEDTYVFTGYPGVFSLDDVTFIPVSAGLAMVLADTRFIVFEGVSDRSELNDADFEFVSLEVQLTSALETDSGQDSEDELTNDPALAGRVVGGTGPVTLSIRFAEETTFVDVTTAVQPDGTYVLTREVLEAAFGETLEDGPYGFVLRATEGDGETTDLPVQFTLDSTAPSIDSVPGGDSEGVLETGPEFLTIVFDGPMSDGAFAAAAYTLSVEGGTAPDITSVDRVDDSTVRINLAASLEDGDYTLAVGAVEDLAGNASAPEDVLFSVDGVTTIISSSPIDGGERINLDRPIVVEFDRAVNEDTLNSDSFQLIASGEALAGRLNLSSNGKVATFFPDELLPSSANVRLVVDGDILQGVDGKQVDADGDGEAGGTFEADFATASVSRVANTNIEGFIFDANYTDDDGLDIPLEGVIVKVVGLPGVEAVTDENGRFFLEDMPIPQVYLDFDATNVANRPEFDYGTIVKPVDTVAGETVGLSSGEKAFNIYFAALAEGDIVELNEGEPTEVGIGETGLANLTEVFPNIDPEEWSKLKVTVPADSLTRDDGSLVEEVTIMAFPPERIPAPLPEGFDPTFVFTLKAGDATNVDGKAQIEMPNVDNLPPGTKRPILSFDHDAGEWVETGTAIVSEDGSVLVSEGDTGVNTLGWKAVGSDPTVPLDDEPKTHDDLGIGDKGFEAFRQNVSSQLADASAAVGIIDTIQSGADVVLPDGPILVIVDAPLTAIGGGLGIAADLVGTGEIGDETWEGIGLGVAADIANLGEAPFEVAGTVLSAGSTALGIKGAMDARQRAIDANKDFGGALVDWAEMFANDVGDFLSDRKRDFDNAVDGAQDFVNDQIDRAGRALDTISRGAEVLGEIYDTYNDVWRYVDGLRNPFPFAEAAANEAENAEDDTPPTEEELLAKIAATQALIDAFTTDFPGQTINQVLEDARSELNGSTDEFEEIVNLALEGASTVKYAVEFDNGLVTRGETVDGKISIQLPLDEVVTISYFAPETGFVRQFTVNTNDLLFSGTQENTIFGRDLIDNDDDGLGAIAEFVIGTSDDNPDTDDDGILDGAEVEQGLNPLDGIGFPTGIIGSLDLQGSALDIKIEGSLVDTLGQTAYIATGSHGLAIVDAGEFSNPILLAELDLTGTNEQVSVDTARGLAYVAGGAAGLHIVDVTDGAAPVLLDTVTFPGGIKSVYSAGGAVIAGGRDLYILNPATGDVLIEAGLNGDINDIFVSGDTIYAIVDQARLVTFNFNGQTLVELDSIVFPTDTIRTPADDMQLFVANDVAYVANGLEVSNVPLFRLLERGGYLTYDVSDPANLVELSGIDTPRVQAGNHETITNGSGLALVAGGFVGLEIHDASDPTNTYDLLASFATPGSAESVALASGIAYVADGTGGLQVINFLPFDANGIAPTVTFNSSASDADPGTEGIQVEEGTRIRLDVDVTDDVQVRNVELLLDGVTVVNDVSGPFDISFTVPPLGDGDNTLEVAVRATDTGGNTTVTDTVTFDIIPDITPPEILSISPNDGQLVLVGENAFTVVFSEAIDPDTISVSNFSVTPEPAGGAMPTAPIDLAFLGDDNILRVTFAELPVGVYTVALDLTGVQDRAGNAISTVPVTQTIEVVDATAVWIDPAGGLWNDVNNWRDTVVPGPEDGVAMVLDDGATAEIRTNEEVQQIRLAGELLLSSGSLKTDELLGDEGGFRQTNGTLRDTRIEGSDDFQVTVSGGIWSNVVLDAMASMPGNSFAQVFVQDGLTIGGSLLIDGTLSTSRVYVEGSQTLGGMGTITMTGANAQLYNYNPTFNDTTDITVIGSDLTLMGNGLVTTWRGEDRWQILGEVVGDDGTLFLQRLAQAGETLSVSTTGDGVVELQTLSEDVALSVADGSDVRINGGTHRGMSIIGPGTASLNGGIFSDLTISGDAIIESKSNSSVAVDVENGLRVDGTLELAALEGRSVDLDIRGTQTIDGTGEILLSRSNSASDGTLTNRIELESQDYGLREVLTIGSGITVRGEGVVTTNTYTDRVEILGTVVGEGAGLRLQRVDNDGGTLTVDGSAGAVTLERRIDNTTVESASGDTMGVTLGDNVQIRDVTLNANAHMGADGVFTEVNVYGGLNVNGTLNIAAGDGTSAYLYAFGTQTIGGTGILSMTAANDGDGSVNNFIQLRSQSGESELLTFGPDLILEGVGTLSANGSTDALRILGTVRGTADGPLVITDLNNAGAELQVDASLGEVRFDNRIADVSLQAVDGQTGTLGITFSTFVDVTLGIDAMVQDGAGSTDVLLVEDGLTLDDSTLTLGGVSGGGRLEFQGEQGLDGTGQVVLSDNNLGAFIGNSTAVLELQGVQSVTERLTIGSGVDVSGTGVVEVSFGDQIQLDGSLIASGGQLQVEELLPVEGSLEVVGASTLRVNGDLTLTERATVSFAEALNGGTIEVTGAAALDGVIDLSVAAGIRPALGAEIVLLEADTITGMFQGFSGFDLGGGLALVLEVRDTGFSQELVVRAVGRAEAVTAGTVDGAPFVPAPRPAEMRTELGIGTLDGTFEFVEIVAPAAAEGSAPVSIADGAILSDVVFKTDAEATATGGELDIEIFQGLELDNANLHFGSGDELGQVELEFDGSQDQTVSGTGRMEFTRDAGGSSPQHRLILEGSYSGIYDKSILTLEAGITVAGHVEVNGNPGGFYYGNSGQIRLLGTAEGMDGSTLTLSGIDNGGAALTVDASEGTVEIAGDIRRTDFVEATDQTGILQGDDLDVLNDVSFGIDTLISDAQGTARVDVHNGLALTGDSTLSLRGWDSQVELEFFGTQTVSGSGTIALLADPDGDSDNLLRLNGLDNNDEEVLTFGAGITLRGAGNINVDNSEDRISILGTVIAEGGTLSLDNINNGGGEMIIDASAGRVEVEGLEDAILTAADGQTGVLNLTGFTDLSNVTLGIDTELLAPFSSSTMESFEGLSLDGITLTLAGSERATARLDMEGTQSLSGNGVLSFDNRFSVDGRGVNNILSFEGTDSDATETFTVGADIDFVGTGQVQVSSGDVLDFDGDILAEGGTFSFQGVEEIDGDLEVRDDGVLSFDRGIGINGTGGLTVALSGGGLDVAAGLVEIAGQFALGGTFSFDVAGDFSAPEGTEILLVEATGGFADSFAAIQGFDLGGGFGLALVADGTQLFARVVASGEAGAQYERADYPIADLPLFNGNQTDVTIDETLVGAPAFEITSGTWSNVILEADATIPADSFGQVFVNNGMTLNGTMTLDDISSSSILYVSGNETVDGTGALVMNGPNAQLYNYNTTFNSTEDTTILGADVSLTGNGLVTAWRSEDRWQILGDVVGDDGTLRLRYLDQAGETLSVSTSKDGIVQLETLSEDVALSVAAGADVRINGGSHTGMSISGAGQARLTSFGVFTDLTVTGSAVIESTSGNSSTGIDIESGLTVDGTLELAALEGRSVDLDIRGTQTIDGTGEILLSRSNVPSDGTTTNRIELEGQDNSVTEVLTIGAGITVRGEGIVTTNNYNDRVEILGTVVGEGSGVTLFRVDNGGGTLTVDGSAGAVALDGRIDNTTVDSVVGDTNGVFLDDNLEIRDVTLDSNALMGEESRFVNVDVYSGLDVNGTLEIAAGDGTSAFLQFRGTQSVDGTGTILMSDRNDGGDSLPNNYIYLISTDSTAETLTIGADLTVRGAGRIEANNTTDIIDIDGFVLGDDGTIIIDEMPVLDGILGATDDGRITADGALDMSDTAGLQIGLSNDGNGVVAVNGTLTQNGTLDFDVADDFVATAGDEFVIVTANFIDGAFDAVTGTDLGGGFGLEVSVRDDDQLIATVIETAAADSFDLGI